jgi:hypothetical protein
MEVGLGFDLQCGALLGYHALNAQRKIEALLSCVGTIIGMQTVLHIAFFITHHAYQQRGLRSMQ